MMSAINKHFNNSQMMFKEDKLNQQYKKCIIGNAPYSTSYTHIYIVTLYTTASVPFSNS